MSLMEFLEIRDGALVPAYGRQVESIRCDWCDFPVEPVLALGSLWVCPALLRGGRTGVGPEMKTLGEYIRELRERNGLSLREFAKNINLSAPFVSDIELGRRFPSNDVFEKMAEILVVSTDELRSFDTRVPISELKKLAQSNPAYGIALRKIADKKVSPEEIIRVAKKKEEGLAGPDRGVPDRLPHRHRPLRQVRKTVQGTGATGKEIRV